MAGAQDEPVVGDLVLDPGRVRIDDPGSLDAVGERPVGHRQDDPVARLEAVDVAERRSVGGAVAGDRHGAALPGQRSVRVVTGALAQGVGVVALDDVGVLVDRGHLDLADRVALERLEADQVVGAGRQLRQLVLELGLLAIRQKSRDWLLPGQGKSGIGDEHRPADHQNGGDEPQHRSHEAQSRQRRVALAPL